MGYTIDQEKVEEITRIVNSEFDPAATADDILTEILADWNAGEEHQDWLDNASPQDIADWLKTFYE